MSKQATSFRLSEEALETIRGLSEELGVSQAAVVELAVRRLAKVEGLPERSEKVSKKTS